MGQIRRLCNEATLDPDLMNKALCKIVKIAREQVGKEQYDAKLRELVEAVCVDVEGACANIICSADNEPGTWDSNQDHLNRKIVALYRHFRGEEHTDGE